MKTAQIAVMTFCLLGIVGATALTAEAGSTYNKSTVVGIDQTQRTITFQTMDGQTLTLPVSDPNILKNGHVSKGDRVSIEIDMGNKITKVTKLSEQHRPGQTTPRDDVRP